MKHFLKPGLAGFAIAAAVLVASTQTAPAAEWKMASGYPDESYLTETLKGFLTDVETQTDGAITVTLHNNQSLVKLEDIPNAVRRGQVALGQVYAANLGNQDPMFTLDAIPFLAPDESSALMLWEAQRPYMEAWFAERGMRILFPQFFPPQGFYTKNPVNSAKDLAGLNLRIYSDITKRMAELLGARPLVVQFGEVPQAFATGMVNAMFTSPQTGIDVQAWDFSTHYNLVGAMRTKLIVVVNEDEFQSLSEPERSALLAAAERAQERGVALGQSVTDEQLQLLRSEGIEVTKASDEFIAELQQVGEQMTAEWRESANDEQRKVLEAYLEMRSAKAGN